MPTATGIPIMMPTLAVSAKKAVCLPSLLAAALLLSACGGGGSSASMSNNSNISTSAGHFSSATQVATPPGAPTNVSYPIGWITFTIVDVPVGGTAVVKFTFPSGTDPTGYMKYQNGAFNTLGADTVTVSGNSLSLSITDGGPLDADGVANGVIVDPGAPYIFTGGSGSSSGGSGSSGSSSSSGAASSSSSSSGAASSSSSSSSSSGSSSGTGTDSSGGSSGQGASSSGSGGSSGATSSSSSSGGATVQTVYSFQGGPADGQDPLGGVTQGNDGNFYGTTFVGGNSEGGTIFKVTPGGAETVLYQFQDSSSDGVYPSSAPVLGDDGNLYGTVAGTADVTSTTATANNGTVYKITPAGVFTSLHAFTGGADGFAPNALIKGSDGNFYGTTEYSTVSSSTGAPGPGTVFKITPAGVLTTLHTFTGSSTSSDGAYPLSGLVQGSDGNFYGTTLYGGAHNIGLVYKITPSGTVTQLYSFTGGADGYKPAAPLLQGSDGNFYGSTVQGGVGANGSGSNGTVFRITPGGALTTLYAFTDGPDGAFPVNGMVQAADGNIYGTTDSGGGNGGIGALYKISPAGVVSPVYDFSSNPTSASALSLGSDGSLYGTTGGGGSVGGGMVYKLQLNGN
jgi:uncharacterized repeat protein (TIGR03803 family)